MSKPNQNPEQKARDNIDKMLANCGWGVQDKKRINFNVGLGVAVREYPTDVGPADYVLFVDRKPVGVIEAKREEEGQHLVSVAEQSGDYANAQLKWVKDKTPLPFIYESTGIITVFRDQRDPKPRSREVFSFHRPETFQEWLSQPDTLRERLEALPPLPPEGLRDCQLTAIQNLESSFKLAKPKALVQMATGAGKTYTAITSVYRLLKHANAKRILFLVDTKNLGEQAEQEFMAFTPNDSNDLFTRLYNVQRLKSSYIPDSSHVCICTIQRLYSILKGEELDEAAEETNPAEHVGPKAPVPVAYNGKIPIEFFDVIIIDECHRSIYNLWRQVLDYFDSFLIGLTATPDKRTFGFFNENVVSEYSHEDAVADGVNVGFDIYTIETEITQKGATLKAKQAIEKRNRLSRKKRWEQQDEEKTYSGKQLDKDVVNPSQIRNVIRTYKDKLPVIFPGRSEVPKTLIFAKTDSHADDIIQVVREEFGEGNDFCKKVTYKAEEDPKSVLAQFRNSYNPRIAVTVDMIATGTDVRPLECLLFMRDVRSKNYFEQMKGRGTRILDHDGLKKVTPSATSNKTHFVIVDAIGVTKSHKTDSRALERKPSVSLKDLLMSVMMGASDDDTLTSLASRLTRLNHQLNPDDHKRIADLTEGVALPEITKGLLDSMNPDKIEAKAKEKFELPEGQAHTDEQGKEAKGDLVKEATTVFTGEVCELLDTIRREHEQTIDTQNIDTVLRAEWEGDSINNATKLTSEFAEYIKEHKDEIVALSIYFDQPFRRKEVTFDMMKELLSKLKSDQPKLAPVRIWQAYALLDKVSGKSPENELTALVSLVRRVCGMDKAIAPYGDTVRENFKDWIFKRHQGSGTKFDEEQMTWLRMIRDHMSCSFHMDQDDLELAPFDGHGGLGRMWELFGEEMDSLIDEMNNELAA
ncbi:DEAD/DEAH box helicase family protein [uncultured Pseudodesulfovibrio sp.]|uniref:type I restriction endonuclease subunit R n=1 Tax=uncultured Pseudodesulfovibrio sp. TaxID=2035858 RepID=UPI0029C755AA|nr:DEAD/DEAH box helicase family protein [uncultured Pseudodesulfovibrio sp.]